MHDFEEINIKIRDITKKLGTLVCQKNTAYGNSVDTSTVIMKELYPDGIPVEKYRDALLVVRILDKLGRIATNKDAFQENPFLDIAGYGIRGAVRNE